MLSHLAILVTISSHVRVDDKISVAELKTRVWWGIILIKDDT